jgi:hypothetical protein
MKTALKTVATVQTCDPFDPTFMIPVGRSPEPLQRDYAGRCQFRSWQKTAWHTLLNKTFAILNSPTGSGKSLIQKALAYTYSVYGERTVIAVPETTIASSFQADFTPFVLPDGTLMTWDLPEECLLLESANSMSHQGLVAKLIAFVEGTEHAPGSRIVVCTHAALREAHIRLARKHGRNAWKGVNVWIDEAHHSKFTREEEEGDAEYDAENDDRINGLGGFTEFFIVNKPGRLLLTTATWLRGDSMSIVAPAYLDQFTTYELPIWQHLDGMNHLKGIRFLFSVSDSYADTARQVISEDPTKQTVFYFPPVTKGQGGAKMQLLSDCKKAFGRQLPSSVGFSNHRFSKTVTIKVQDFVTIEGREIVEEAFTADKRAADVFLVQNKFREGTDAPRLARAVVFGVRSSLPMVIQMAGRLLRDEEGKPYVEYHTVLPSQVGTDFESFEQYLGAVFMTMALGWSFQSQLALPAKALSQRVMQVLIDGMADLALGGTHLPVDEACRKAIAGAVAIGSGELGPKDENGDYEGYGPDNQNLTQSAKTLADSFRGALRMAAALVREKMDAGEWQQLGEMIEVDPLKASPIVFRAHVGATQYKDFCAAYMGVGPKLSPQYVHQCTLVHIWKGQKKDEDPGPPQHG